MIKIIPILVAAFLLYLLVQSFKRMPVEQRKTRIFQYLTYAIVGLLILAVVTGRVHWLGAVAAAALAGLKMSAGTIMRFLPFLQYGSRAGFFKNPVFKTPNLEIKFDLKTGSMSGLILAGEHQGKALDTLDEPELEQLQQWLSERDKRAYYLLGVYRQRRTRNSGNNSHYQTDVSLSNPSEEEARLILGLPEKFSKKDLDLAYKRLMQKLHPDRGGNDYLASRVNLARDVLLKQFTK